MNKKRKKWYLVGVVFGFIVLFVCLFLFMSRDKSSFSSVFSSMLAERNGTFEYDVSLTGSEKVDGGATTSTLVHIIRQVQDLNESIEASIKYSEEDVVILSLLKIDKMYYLNMTSLKDSLSACKSVTLKAYGDSIPVNVPYVEISEGEFKFVSNYCETVEEGDAYYTGVDNLFSRMSLLCNTLVNSSISQGGVKQTVKDSDYMLSTTDVSSYSPVFKNFLNQAGTFYDRYTENLIRLNLATEYEKTTGFAMERDNFVSSLSPLWVKYNAISDVDLGASLSGSVNVYTPDSGASEYRGGITLFWNDRDLSYTINLKMSSVPTVASKFEAPTSSVADLEFFETSYFKLSDLLDTLILEGNFTDLSLLDNKLTLDKDGLTEQQEITLGRYLGVTSSEVQAYVAENLSSDTKIQDFIDSFKIITNLEVSDKSAVVEIVEPVAVSPYHTLTGSYNDCEYAFSVNESLSSSTILAVNVRLLNHAEKSFTIKSNKFKLSDLASDKISANVEAQVLEVNPDFDKTLLVQSYTVEPGCFIDSVIYFVVPEGTNYWDLSVNKELAGNLVSK